MNDTIYYAIGDVHGELDKLKRLHAFILEDAARAGAPFTIVHLGDLIDRGPDSRGVVAAAMALEQSQSCVTLRGNHEQMMLAAFDNSMTAEVSNWVFNGGDVAIRSYEQANGAKTNWRDCIDKEHVAWLRQRPFQHFDEARNILFVHAGIDPRQYPNCPDDLKIWTRSRNFFDTERWPARPEFENFLVVHGHTPTEDFEPEVVPKRINIDTGAVFGGSLTCVVLEPGAGPRFLRAA